jgi:hypothetical protein
MKIGTDISLAECRAEGYGMIEFNKSKLLKKGILQKDTPVRYFRTFGYLSHDEKGRPLELGMMKAELYITDTLISWNDLIEIYEPRKEGIDNFADFKNCPLNWDNPTEYDLLTLADIIDSYCGIE